MNMWFVNENVRSVNEKRMPTLNSKHDDLRRTASVRGQKKLAFKPISRKTVETEVSFNLFHCFRLLKWGAFDKIFKILGVCGYIYLRKRLTDMWHRMQYQILLLLGRWVIFDIRAQSSILAKFLSCDNKRK